ncbi:hypothetical protein [Tenacibaculum jejuense]|uniref:Lipoprotein n=1 Tax=Tenacibaculum jejuense TaxID=584609 RepID=A0A238U6H3_9FLAO|nr:hypothetical protein [Tenacibaculum jejuense]SNR14188.1 protein of unknown function [Tenacibaculum jejuense]
MKLINILIIFLLTISCTQNKAIFEFNRVLGKENGKTLKLLTKNFENNFLKNHYPNSELTQSYKKFLIDYEKGEFKDLPYFLPKKNIDDFNHSNLKKEIYYHPDSVWVLKNSTYDKVEEDSLLFLDVNKPYIKLRKKNLFFSEANKIVYDYERHYVHIDSTTNIDSLINKTMNLRYRNLYDGKYIQAIGSIRELNEFYELFYSTKIIIGFGKREVFNLIKEKGNLNNELVRQLIIIEFVL